MAKESKYPYKITGRLTGKAGKTLEKRAKSMKIGPAVLLRQIVERALEPSPGATE